MCKKRIEHPNAAVVPIHFDLIAAIEKAAEAAARIANTVHSHFVAQ